MYKKIMIVFLIFLTFTNLKVVAQDHRQYFQIVGDSNYSEDVYRVKNELIHSFQDLVMGLDESEYSAAIKNTLPEDERISYKNHTVTIVLGDGMGKVLEGELKTNYCFKDSESIETHFFFGNG